MRIVPPAAQATSIGIALFFALFWGSEALWTLNAPNFGIGDTLRSEAIHSVGRLFDLEAGALMGVAAFFATIKLVTASIFGLHVLDRFAGWFGRPIDHESLDAGLLLATVMTIALTVPALADGKPALVGFHANILLLAGVAALLSGLEQRRAIPVNGRRVEQVSAAKTLG